MSKQEKEVMKERVSKLKEEIAVLKEDLKVSREINQDQNREFRTYYKAISAIQNLVKNL